MTKDIEIGILSKMHLCMSVGNLVDEAVNITKAKTNQRVIFNGLPEIVKLQEDEDIGVIQQQAISDEKTLVPSTSSSEELRL